MITIPQLALALLVVAGLPESRATQMAGYVVEAARAHRVGPALVAAVMESESGFVGTRVGKIGELGISQMHPKFSRGKAYRSFRGTQDEKDRFSIFLGAEALRHGMLVCGFNMPKAVGFYKSGRCVSGPRARHVMIVRARIIRASGGSDV